MVVIAASMSTVISVGIIPTLEVLDTGTTGCGDTVCVGSGEASDMSTVASTPMTNFLLISEEAYIAAIETLDINSVADSTLILVLTDDDVLFFVAITFF